MAITVGTLVVDLVANTASFVSGLDKAGQMSLDSTKKMSRAFTQLAGIATSAFFAAETAIVAMVENAIRNADRLHDVAQAAGVSTEALSALEYAAQQSGLSSEELAKGLGRLAKSALAAASGGRESQNAYKTLGVAVSDLNGRLRPSQDILLDLAEKFSRMHDGPMKTALALQIFGRAGANLLPLLNEGRQGVTALMEEAKALGLVVGDDFADAADQFEDSMKRMKGAAQGMANTIARDALPKLNFIMLSLGEDVQNTQSRFQDFARASAVVIQSTVLLFSDLQAAIDLTRLIFARFGDETLVVNAAIGESIRALAARDFAALPGIASKTLAFLKGSEREFLAASDKLWADHAEAIKEYLLAGESGTAKAKPRPTLAPSAPSGDAAANEKATEAIKRKIAALEAAALAASREALAQQGDTAATWLYVAAATAQQKIDELNAQADEKKIKHLTADQESHIRAAEVLKAFSSRVGEVNKSLADSILATNQQAAATRAMAEAYAEGGAAIAKAEEDAKLEPFREKVRQAQLALDLANQSGDRFSKEGLANLAQAALLAKDRLQAETVALREMTAAERELNTEKLIVDTRRWTTGQELLTKALFQGAAAMREQFIEQKRREFLADKGQDPARVGEYVAALRQQLDVQRLLSAEERLDSARRRKDLDDELTDLRELRAQLIANGATTLEIDAAIHAAELQKIHDQADLLLQMENLGAGARAFFLSYGKNATDAQRAFEMLSRGFDDLSTNIAKALTGQKASWHDFLTSLAEEFTKFLLNKAFQRLFSFLGLAGGGGGGFSILGALSPASIGGMEFLQGGGPALAGQSYIVGENGPEVFTPGVSGTVSPNSSLSTVAPVTVYQTVNIQTSDADSFRRSRAQIANDMAAMAATANRRR